MTISVQTPPGQHVSPINIVELGPMPGLTLQIPAGVREEALILLNVPAPFKSGDTGYVAFGISVDGRRLPANAKFTGPREARVPSTLVAAVPLAPRPQTIVALWGGFDTNGVIDSPATLSALF